MRIVHELHASGFVEKRHLTEEESNGVYPRKKNARDNLTDTLLSEAQVFTPHGRRIDQEHSGMVSISNSMHDLTDTNLVASAPYWSKMM